MWNDLQCYGVHKAIELLIFAEFHLYWKNETSQVYHIPLKQQLRLLIRNDFHYPQHYYISMVTPPKVRQNDSLVMAHKTCLDLCSIDIMALLLGTRWFPPSSIVWLNGFLFFSRVEIAAGLSPVKYRSLRRTMVHKDKARLLAHKEIEFVKKVSSTSGYTV